MSPIEPTGASAFARGAPHTTTNAFSTRSGAQKAQSLQSVVTAAAAAPVETARAVAQAQASSTTRMQTETRPAAQDVAARDIAAISARARRDGAQAPDRPEAARVPPPKPHASLAKPMTAVLLHELRLQQELADVQEEKATKLR